MADNFTITFNYQGAYMTVQCKQTDKIDDVFAKFFSKAQVNQNDVKFYHNSREFLVWGKTLEQLGFKNFTTFDVVNEKHVSGA